MSAPAHRPGAWLAFGVLVPLLAFALDAGLRVDPILWGADGFMSGMEGGRPTTVHARQLIVYTFVAAPMLGLLLLLRARTRAARAIALPLLGLGVLTAGLHAVVFLPLLPLSVVAIIMLGLGLLGFAPYAALAVYVHALSVAIREQRADCDGRPWRWVAAPLAATALPLLFTLGPYLHARGVVDDMRGGGPAAISSGFRELGALAPLVRPELASIYVELEGPAQARMRNLFLERFDEDVDAALGGRMRLR